MIPEWAIQYVGAPFAEKGYGLPEGYNCWTLARAIQWEQYAVELPAYNTYSDTKDRVHIDQTITTSIEYWTEITQEWKEIHEWSVGALIIFKLRGYALHIGTIADAKFMVHITEGIDASLGRYRDPAWGPRICGMYQHISRLL